MKCPYCSHNFALTWKRYLTSMFGKHTCPSCSNNSKINSGLIECIIVWNLIVVIVAVFTFGIASLNSNHYSEKIVLAFSIVVSIVMITPIDKLYTSRKTLEKYPTNK